MKLEPIYAKAWRSLCSQTVGRTIKAASGRRWFAQYSAQFTPELLLIDGVHCTVILDVELAVKNFPGEARDGGRSLRLIGLCKASISAPEGPHGFWAQTLSRFDFIVKAQTNPDVSTSLAPALTEALALLKDQPVFAARHEAAQIAAALPPPALPDPPERRSAL